MAPDLQIHAELRDYAVIFGALDVNLLRESLRSPNAALIVDSNLSQQLRGSLAGLEELVDFTLILEANEQTKEVVGVATLMEELLDRGVTRRHTIIAVGGGTIQDAVSFSASVLMRGIDWLFIPTTLVSQADSCIGSKTSVNLGTRKNALGTFWPPAAVAIDTGLLKTLSNVSIRSGIGEMLKVHAIRGPEAFDRLAVAYDTLWTDDERMLEAIVDSLRFKRDLIHVDERDSGARLVMNYGHTFGHALETSSGFSMEHGIAVTLGCDIANYVGWQAGVSAQSHYERMHEVLMRNAGPRSALSVDCKVFEQALVRDKKHSPETFVFILPDREGIIRVMEFPRESSIARIAVDYLERLLAETS